MLAPERLRLTCPCLPNFCRFHNVVPQEGLPLLTPSQLSQLVVNRAKRTGGSLLLDGWRAGQQLVSQMPAVGCPGASLPCRCGCCS